MKEFGIDETTTFSGCESIILLIPVRKLGEKDCHQRQNSDLRREGFCRGHSILTTSIDVDTTRGRTWSQK
jgi:hypothetical protein